MYPEQELINDEYYAFFALVNKVTMTSYVQQTHFDDQWYRLYHI